MIMGILTIFLSHNSNNRKLKVIILLLQKICSTILFQTKVHLVQCIMFRLSLLKVSTLILQDLQKEQAWYF